MTRSSQEAPASLLPEPRVPLKRAAEILGVTPRTLRRFADEGLITFHRYRRDGYNRRGLAVFDPAELRRFLSESLVVQDGNPQTNREAVKRAQPREAKKAQPRRGTRAKSCV